jgi:hypothetical protein
MFDGIYTWTNDKQSAESTVDITQIFLDFGINKHKS